MKKEQALFPALNCWLGFQTVISKLTALNLEILSGNIKNIFIGETTAEKTWNVNNYIHPCSVFMLKSYLIF